MTTLSKDNAPSQEISTDKLPYRPSETVHFHVFVGEEGHAIRYKTHN